MGRRPIAGEAGYVQPTMARHHRYRVWQQAQRQLVEVARVTEGLRFGDLTSQLRRAAISVVSNIVEGAGRCNDSEFTRFLIIARASNDEIAAQLEITSALTGTDVTAMLAANDHLGRMLTTLIGHLRDAGS
jgi:four helix bundle protein